MKRCLTALMVALAAPTSAGYAATPAPSTAPAPTYADLAQLADQAPLIVRAEIRKQAMVDAARAPGVRPGWVRLYAEVRTQALLFGNTAVGESLRYLVDVPLDSRGKAPSLRKRSVIIFAASPTGARPGDLQLVTADAQIDWSPEVETRLRGIIGELNATGAPGRITSVREAIHVPGTLSGEGETQIFLSTPDESAASIIVQHKVGESPRWSASFSEVLSSGDAPARDTLPWFRLACSLPAALPAGANLSEGPTNAAMADRDYRMVIEQLGPCERTRK